MTLVRISVKGIAKSYGLKVVRVKKRLKKLKIKSKNGHKGHRLYSPEDAKAVGEYLKNKALSKEKSKKKTSPRFKRNKRTD